MLNRQTSCVHDGDTYLGTFADAGRGADARVTVWYGGAERTESVGSHTVNGAARRLLGELVRDQLCREAAPEAVD